jgi:hypothetical protein
MLLTLGFLSSLVCFAAVWGSDLLRNFQSGTERGTSKWLYNVSQFVFEMIFLIVQTLLK